MNCKVVEINCENENTITKKKQYGERLTPQSFLVNRVYQKLPDQKKKKRKIPVDEFEILEYSEYYMLLNNNYTVQQLKQMCKYYKQKVGGNKSQLNFRWPVAVPFARVRLLAIGFRSPWQVAYRSVAFRR